VFQEKILHLLVIYAKASFFLILTEQAVVLEETPLLQRIDLCICWNLRFPSRAYFQVEETPSLGGEVFRYFFLRKRC